MTQTTPLLPQLMTMEAYLAYESDTDTRHELVNGVLVAMSTESQGNLDIAKYLMFELARYLPLALLAIGTEVEVSGSRATSRLPDLLVHSEESRAALTGSKRAILLRDMPPPAIVVEVVSPGQKNRDRDYRHKRIEYAAREISEYWIIDPEEQKITLCRWVNGQYEDRIYTGNDLLQSSVACRLTAEQVLAFGKAAS